jgi:hypothetical protein
LFRSVALTPPLAGSAAAAPAAAGSVAVAAPAAGHVTAGRCHDRGDETFTFRSGTADTGTGFACATGRSFAGPDSPLAPPGGCVIPVRNGTAVTTAHVTTATRRPRPRPRPAQPKPRREKLCSDLTITMPFQAGRHPRCGTAGATNCRGAAFR